MVWYGWAWSGGSWQRLATAATLTGVNRQLSLIIDPLGIPDTMTCLTRSAGPPVGRPAAIDYMDSLMKRLKGTPCG